MSYNLELREYYSALRGVVIFRGLDKVEVTDGNNPVVTFEFDRVV
jgi:hypothetical protein